MFGALALFFGGVFAHWLGTKMLHLRYVDKQTLWFVKFVLTLAAVHYDDRERFEDTLENTVKKVSESLNDKSTTDVSLQACKVSREMLSKEKEAFIKLLKAHVHKDYVGVIPFNTWKEAMFWLSGNNSK